MTHSLVPIIMAGAVCYGFQDEYRKETAQRGSSSRTTGTARSSSSSSAITIKYAGTIVALERVASETGGL